MSAVRFDVFTLFPSMLGGHLNESVIRRAIDRSLLAVEVHDIREYGIGRHRIVDDTPYGGGAGMVMMAQPVFESVESILSDDLASTPVIYLSPAGEVFNQAIAHDLATLPRIALICGRYEGIDQRVRDHLVTRELSIGDYVLTGGELAASVVIDAVSRLIPGVIDSESLEDETFSEGLLEYPHYTRPAEYRGWEAPEVLLSGNHGQIAAWRREQALELTRSRRPELLGDP